MTANHRANDVIVKEGAPQLLLARFMYGPLDMITLAGIITIDTVYEMELLTDTTCLRIIFYSHLTWAEHIAFLFGKLSLGLYALIKI